MIKVAVCDDDEQVRKELSSYIKMYFKTRQLELYILEFNSGIDLLKVNIRLDIIFLDIEMPQLNGIMTAEKLRNWDVRSKIIYISNYEQYKLSAYSVHAFDYICKPIDDKTIYGLLDEVIRYIEGAVTEKKYVFKTDQGIVSLKTDDIYYFEYLSRKVSIVSTKGIYVASYSLKMISEKISKEDFCSPHKSFIVNMLYVKQIKGFDIFMENGDVIPLAQKRAVVFKRSFNDYLQSTFDKI